MFSLTPEEWIAVALSLRIAVVATVVSLPFGIAIAWLLARKDFWGKALLDGIVHLPLVLPPVVTGYLRLITFGRRGAVGLLPGTVQHRLALDQRDPRARGRESHRRNGWGTPLRAGRARAAGPDRRPD